MPLERVLELEKQTYLGLWEISEDSETLYPWVSNKALGRYSEIKHERRKRQFLAGRLLIQELSGDGHISVEIDQFQKPVVKDWQVSLAHWRNYAVALISKPFHIGVDVEGIQDKLLHLESKFLSEEERVWVSLEGRDEHLCKCWSAKECIYKFWGKRKLEFKRHMKLHPFSQNASHVFATLQKERVKLDLKVEFLNIPNGVISYLIHPYPAE